MTLKRSLSRHASTATSKKSHSPSTRACSFYFLSALQDVHRNKSVGEAPLGCLWVTRGNQSHRHRRCAVAKNRLLYGGARRSATAGNVDDRGAHMSSRWCRGARRAQEKLDEAHDLHRVTGHAAATLKYRHCNQRIADHHVISGEPRNWIVVTGNELERWAWSADVNLIAPAGRRMS
jgi:hypothetical protein